MGNIFDGYSDDQIKKFVRQVMRGGYNPSFSGSSSYYNRDSYSKNDNVSRVEKIQLDTLDKLNRMSNTINDNLIKLEQEKVQIEKDINDLKKSRNKINQTSRQGREEWSKVTAEIKKLEVRQSQLPIERHRLEGEKGNIDAKRYSVAEKYISESDSKRRSAQFQYDESTRTINELTKLKENGVELNDYQKSELKLAEKQQESSAKQLDKMDKQIELIDKVNSTVITTAKELLQGFSKAVDVGMDIQKQYLARVDSRMAKLSKDESESGITLGTISETITRTFPVSNVVNIKAASTDFSPD